MVEEFTARRGYDPLPYLPALSGAIVGSPARSETFLYDFRCTLADLLADSHYGAIANVAHEITYTAASTYKADAPLRPSGLIGPVTLWAE